MSDEKPSQQPKQAQETGVSEPGLARKAVNFTETMIHVAAKAIVEGKVQVQKTEAERRIDICKGCQMYLAAREVCGVCGCNMPFKTRLIAGRCPRGKW